MRLTLIFYISVFFLSGLFSQQDHQVSQYMYDHISNNPGSAGSGDGICVTGILKEQWTGIEGGPYDLIGSIHLPFKLFKKDHGVGLSFLHEEIGNFQDNDIRLAYAYRANVGDGKLGIGLGLNIQFRDINPDWRLNVNIPGNVNEHDDIAIPTSGDQIRAFDVYGGIFYYTDDLYFGISSTHINETSYKYVKENDSGEGTIKIKRHYYLTSGYTMQLANPSFEIVPSVLIQSDGVVHKIDINTQLVYNKKFWGGVSFRPGSSLVGMLGFEILNGAKISFAYDFPVSTITNYYQYSYEVMVNYCFKIGVEKAAQKYKSIRFL